MWQQVEFTLGTWQGIYLCEFRDYGGARKIVATITGDNLWGIYVYDDGEELDLNNHLKVEYI